MTRNVLSDPFATAYLGDFRLVNNVWNIKKLLKGETYTQTIGYSPGSTPDNVTFRWDFGDHIADSVLAYPEIIAGYKPWDQTGSAALTARVDAVCDFQVKVDTAILGETQKFNVAFDLWLTSVPKGDATSITTEVMVWLHGRDIIGPDLPRAHYQDSRFSGNVYVTPDFGGIDGVFWNYIAFVADTDITKGEIDLGAMLKFLRTQKLVKPADYVTGFEFGSEVTTGAGALTINTMSYRFRQCPGDGPLKSQGGDRPDKPLPEHLSGRLMAEGKSTFKIELNRENQTDGSTAGHVQYLLYHSPQVAQAVSKHLF